MVSIERCSLENQPNVLVWNLRNLEPSAPKYFRQFPLGIVAGSKTRRSFFCEHEDEIHLKVLKFEKNRSNNFQTSFSSRPNLKVLVSSNFVRILRE